MVSRLAALPGYVAEGDVFGVEWELAQGHGLQLVNDDDWPAPSGIRFGIGDTTLVITDRLVPIRAGIAMLRPPSLVAGIHPAPTATGQQIEDLLIDTLAAAGLARSSVVAVATIHHARNDRSLRRLGYPIRSFAAAELDLVDVPHPSSKLRPIVGTKSVCEAAALLSAGPDASLVVERTRSPIGTIAVARRHPSDGGSTGDSLVTIETNGSVAPLRNPA